MNRFDEGFNEIDPITARPFSNGHPDGVWIISFIYGFLLLFAFIGILMGAFKLFTGEYFEGGSLLVGNFINFALFLPLMKLLLNRSEKAVGLSIFIFFLLLFCVGLIYLFNPSLAFAPVFMMCVQAYICFYILGLKKDGLLGVGVSAANGNY